MVDSYSVETGQRNLTVALSKNRNELLLFGQGLTMDAFCLEEPRIMM